jgi:hypothetical protein
MHYAYAAAYAQVINIFETMLWVGKPWKLKPPFPVADGEVGNDSYHVLLALLYVAPFAVFLRDLLTILELTTLTWLLNDVTWHLWAVNFGYHLDWLRFYFNPNLRVTVWYARFGLFKVPVTPRRMFLASIARIVLLAIFTAMNNLPTA